MPFDLFIAYSHNDLALKNELEAHLSSLKRQGLITVWHDGNIQPGTEWEAQTVTRLQTAQIILLLLSADFLASQFCYGVQVQQAIERHETNAARVIPIILRPNDRQGTLFEKLQVLPTEGKAVIQWPSHDEAFTDVVRGLRTVIEDLQRHLLTHPSITSNTQPFNVLQIPYWHIPLPRNLYFTGRQDVLSHLHETLHSNQPIAISQPHAINGLGGIGKTQIALEFAYRYGQNYHAVFWLRAESRETFISDIVTVATLLNLPEQQAQDQERTIEAFTFWLQMHDQWLLIFDNADDLSLLHDFLPLRTAGHVLLTTRTHASGGLARMLPIDRMEPEEGALFLLRRAGLLGLDASLDQVAPIMSSDARSIVEEVDGLPLALDQAGAYLEETSCSLADYLTLLRNRRNQQRLLSKRGGLTEYHPDPVATTWSLSFAKVKVANPAAAELLAVCAFLAPDAIPETLFLSGAEHLGPLLQSIATDTMAFNDAIGELLKYSLVQREIGTHLLSMHRLVQAILKASMDEEIQQQWAERAVKAVNAVFPYITFENWPLCQECLPHALVCSEHIEQWNMSFFEAARLLNQAAFYLKERGQYPEALPLSQRALAIYEQALGPSHPETATSLNNLALLYQSMGNYSEALPLLQQALAIREQTLGPSHPETANSLNNLAALYENMGSYPEALPLYQRALAIYKQALGPTHPFTAINLNNLAALYENMGNYTEALPLHLQALAIREQALGPSHPETASSLNNLASLYKSMGNFPEALPLFQRALAINEQALGPSHPTTLIVQKNLHKLEQKIKEQE